MSSSPASLPVQSPLNLMLNIQPGKNQTILDYLERTRPRSITLLHRLARSILLDF